MQFDWLKARQDFGYELPYLGDVGYQRIRLDTVAAVLLVACVPSCGGRFIPRNFLLRAYPLHLLLLGVVRSVV
ncbi:TPA: hypothetical protein IGZ65_005114 [Escherichia coli]|nr:hypothetical protein [Escherichia coli]